MSDVPWIEATTLGREDAHATWALAARMHLGEVARSYHAVVTTAALAAHVQERSRIRTRQQPRHWMGDVLYRTMQADTAQGEPFLASLVVDAHGHVNAGYAGVVEHLREVAVADPDRHAGEERLDCYRTHGAALPDGGGVPGPWPSTPEPRERRAPAARAPRVTRVPGTPASPRTSAAGPPSTRAVKVETMPKICPTCFMALPSSGQCDNCD